MDWGQVAQIGAGLMADQKAGKLTDQQFALQKQQLAQMAGIPLPELEKVIAQQLGPSAMAGIPRNESLRHQQLANLQALQDIANGGGLSIGDRAGIEQANSAADAADRRRRASILAELAGRGQLDSGAALVASQSSAQDAANRARSSAQDVAARAEARKMDALRAIAQGTSSLRGQDFSEAAAKAQAQDEIARWNATAREKAGYYNAGLPQQQFENIFKKTTGQQGPANNLAAAYGAEAQGVRGQGAAAGQAAHAAINGMGSGGSQQQPMTSDYDRTAAAVATSNPYPSDPAANDPYEFEDPWRTNGYDIREEDDK